MPRPTPCRADTPSIQRLGNRPVRGGVGRQYRRAIGRTFAGKASAAVRFAAAPPAWASSRLVGFPSAAP